MGRRRTAAVLTAGLLATTLTGMLAPGAQATVSGAQVGVVADITWGTSAATVSTTVSSMTNAGVGWVRANVSWSGIEPDVKGTLNQGYLADIDYAVNQARAAGIKVLMPLADGVPFWASADPSKYVDASGAHWNKYWRPTRASDYGDFVQAMVAHYQALGVHTFELWNEPNTTTFWPSGPNAGEYKALLAAAYPAAKAADPTATVLMGGLSKNDYDYLGQLYAAGGRPYFDAVAVHPYTGSADPTWCWNQAGTTKLAKDAFCGIEEVRNTMVGAGDSAKAIWLTEFGWSTTTAAYGVSEATQADFLTKAFTKLQSYSYVAAAFWYNLRNTWWLADTPADYEANLGLMRTDFSAKPAYGALRSWTGGPAPTTTSTTVAPAPTTTSTTVAPAPTTTSTTVAPAPTTTTTVAPTGDTTGPVLTDVRTLSVGSTSVGIAWTTNELSDSQVEIWGGPAPTTTVVDATDVTAHSVTLSGLSPWTRYSYRVRSVDPAGNATTSPNYSLRTAR